MSRLSEFATRNPGLKLFALLLAIGIWLVFVPEEKTYSEKTLAVPLETRNIPRDLELVEKPASTIDVTVRAPNRLLNAINPSDVHVLLDLEKASKYQTGYPLNRTMVILPQGAEVVKINPNQVNLVLEPAHEVTLNVVPVIIGRPAEGFRQAKISVAPSEVVVRGPESRISARDTVTTSPVDITGLTQSAVFTVDLIMPKPELRVVSGPVRARVSVIIVPEDEASEPPPPVKKKK